MKEEIEKAKFFATLLDSQFKVGGIRFGIDPILSAIPIVGNLVGVAMSVHILGIAKRYNVSAYDQIMMIFNIILDFIVGLIPVIGVIFDVGLKANMRNIKILEKYLEKAKVNGKVIEGQLVTD